MGMAHLVWTEIPYNSRHHLVNNVLSIILQHNTEKVKRHIKPIDREKTLNFAMDQQLKRTKWEEKTYSY